MLQSLPLHTLHNLLATFNINGEASTEISSKNLSGKILLKTELKES